jgi:geranylgeranyl diphosphate synthase, type II
MTAQVSSVTSFMVEGSKMVNDALRQFSPYSDCTELHEAIEYALFPGGKRLRPILAIACGKLFDKQGDSLSQTACAIEMLHTASVIFDDLQEMDNAQSRRGMPTLHVQFSPATAILAAHSLVSIAFEICSGLDLPGELKASIIHKLSHAVGPFGMAAGQVEDLKGCTKAHCAEVLCIAKKKTAGLFEAACYSSARVQGADENQATLLAKFGSALGVAFQIADDLHDFEREDDLEKSVNVIAACGKSEAKKAFSENIGQARKIAAHFGSNQLQEIVTLVENYAGSF